MAKLLWNEGLRARRHLWRGMCVSGAMLFVVAIAPTAALARPQTATLRLRVIGLPVGTRPVAVLTGPGLHLSVGSPQSRVRRLRPGRYTLTVRRLTFARSSGHVRAGAIAYPSQPRVSVRLRAGKTANLTGAYREIVNPGVVSERADVLTLRGAPSRPTSVVLAGHQILAAGTVLSLAPSASAPDGVLARVRASHFSRASTTVTLTPVPVVAVVPVAEFNVPLRALSGSRGRQIRPELLSGSCSPEDPVYRRIENIRFAGGWNTERIFGVNVKVGVHLQVDFDADTGVSDTEGLNIGGTCEIDLSASGMAGPIPVTAAIYGQASASVSAGVTLSADASVHVTAASSSYGIPPAMVLVPDLSFSNPSIKFSASAGAQASASIGVGVKAGIGTDGVASATVNFSNSIGFSAQPGGCSVDATFGAFSVEGELLGWDIETPKTPALFSKTLWHNPCDASGGSGSGDGSGGTGGGSGGPTLPSVGVTPLGPTSGPSGLGLNVSMPSCSAGSVAVSFDGTYAYDIAPTSTTQMMILPMFLGTGSHQVSLKCWGQWLSSGFPVHITSSAIPLELQATTVAPGGSLVFKSGASQGPHPCPTLPGYPQMTMSWRLDTTDPSPSVVAGPGFVNMPDNAANETLTIPSTLAPGTYTARQTCAYIGGPGDQGIGLVDFPAVAVSVS